MTGPQCQWLLPAPKSFLRRCWRIILGRPVDWADIVQCGLLHGHDGKHAPFPVGDFLYPMSLLHPVDVLLVEALHRCPAGCGTRVVDWEPTLWIRQGNGWYCQEDVTVWRFRPCGHEFRERLDPAP